MEAEAKDKTTLRDEIHRFVDQLPEGELQTAHRFVEYLRHNGDPLLKKLMDAPEEPAEDDEIAALEEAWEDVREGRLHTHEEVKKELGL